MRASGGRIRSALGLSELRRLGVTLFSGWQRFLLLAWRSRDTFPVFILAGPYVRYTLGTFDTCGRLRALAGTCGHFRVLLLYSRLGLTVTLPETEVGVGEGVSWACVHCAPCKRSVCWRWVSWAAAWPAGGVRSLGVWEMLDDVLCWSAVGRWGGLVLWHVLVALLRVACMWFCCMCCALFAVLAFSVWGLAG